MKIKDITTLIEEFAPLSWQEEYDNSGLNIGHSQNEITGILLCVDVTENIIDEAIELNANLIISHHPAIFHPLRNITGTDAIQRTVEKAIKHEIALYAAHTNLDSAPTGLSYQLGNILGIRNMQTLSPRAGNNRDGFGIIGDLDQGPTPPLVFLKQVKDKLDCGAIRYSEICFEKVSRIALSTGSCASFTQTAIEAGAEIYLTADLKYNDFYTPDGKMIIADIGHFESEYCAIELLFDIITKKIATFAVHKSKCALNPVNYLV